MLIKWSLIIHKISILGFFSATFSFHNITRPWKQIPAILTTTPSCFCGLPLRFSGKESAYNVGDPGSIPGLGWSPGEGKGYPLQLSGLENSMDCIVHGVAKSRTGPSDFHFTSSPITDISHMAVCFSMFWATLLKDKTISHHNLCYIMSLSFFGCSNKLPGKQACCRPWGCRVRHT